VQKDFGGDSGIGMIVLTSAYILELTGGLLILLLMIKDWVKFDKLFLILLILMTSLIPIGFFLSYKTIIMILLKVFAAITFMSIMMYGSELFPTLIRARSIGIITTFGKIGGFLMPFIMYSILEMDPISYLSFIFVISLIFMIVVFSTIRLLKYPNQQQYSKFTDEPVQP